MSCGLEVERETRLSPSDEEFAALVVDWGREVTRTPLAICGTWWMDLISCSIQGGGGGGGGKEKGEDESPVLPSLASQRFAPPFVPTSVACGGSVLADYSWA